LLGIKDWKVSMNFNRYTLCVFPFYEQRRCLCFDDIRVIGSCFVVSDIKKSFDSKILRMNLKFNVYEV